MSNKFTCGLIFVIVSLVLPACSQQEATKEEGVSITLTNPLPLARKDEPVVLDRAFLESHLGEFVAQAFPVIKRGDELIPSQVDDLDGDGQWDELAFVLDLAAAETRKLSLFVETGDAPVFIPRSNIRFAEKTDQGYVEFIREARPVDYNFDNRSKHYQMEGPGWENDMVGFRNYFDERNGLDIFGKKTATMVLDKAGINENYHEMQDWGMDILKVGSSLGAGALAARVGDDIVRLGNTEEKIFEIISEGPVRSIFTLTYRGWKLGERSVDLVHQISIWAGQHFYQSDIRFLSDETPTSMITGIVNFKSDRLLKIDDESGRIALATFAPQGEMDELLGMAIVLDRTLYEGDSEVPAEGDEITNSFLVELASGDASQAIQFRFYAVWVPRHTAFSNETLFLDLLNNEAKRWSNPIGVRVE